MDKKDCGALWSRSKDGKEYMTGNITIEGKVYEIVVFANSYKKEGERTPDWRIYHSRPRTEAVEEPVVQVEEDNNPDNIPF